MTMIVALEEGWLELEVVAAEVGAVIIGRIKARRTESGYSSLLVADFRMIGRTAVGGYMIDRLHLNRPMLQKLRRSRHDQEQTHQQFVALFERNLALIAAALADEDLSKRKRRGLEADLAAARSQYERYLTSWKQRWEPLYSTEDY